eukprot:UN04979
MKLYKKIKNNSGSCATVLLIPRDFDETSGTVAWCGDCRLSMIGVKENSKSENKENKILNQKQGMNG